MIIRRQWAGSARVLQVLNLIGPEGPIAPRRNPREEPQEGNPGRNLRKETLGGGRKYQAHRPRSTTGPTAPQAPQHHSTTGPHSHSTQCAHSITTITINLDRKAGQPVRLSLHLVPKLQ